MRELEPLFLGRTFDDFLFRPRREPGRHAADVELDAARRGPRPRLPIAGANMDTVVGEEMAKTLALEGAFGFLHRSARSSSRPRASAT